MKLGENLILILFIIVVVAGGYAWYAYWRTPGVVMEDPGGETSGQEFLSMANRLKGIQIDTDFLQSPEFTSLQDLTPYIELPMIVGKKNPFLPLNSVSLPPLKNN